MRRVIFTMALAAAMVFAFGGVATAKYAGYAYNTAGGGHVGYLSWAGAKALMTANGVDASLQNTPHGGYTANTTKCAVCHSVHRAASDATAAGVASYWKLTPGAQACTACHTAWGANPIPTALVEWGNPADGGGGPHNSFNCLNACHAGIHGGTTSVYGAVTAFNLTNRNDAAIAAALAAGNIKAGIVDATTVGGAYTALSTVQAAVNRAMVTGYTCGASGCHSSSQFAVNADGYAELRAGDPGASSTLNTFMTGHGTAGNTLHCSTGACHQTIGSTSDSSCAACHDMVGKATNSSAFPHGNRNLTVWEWTRPAGVLTQTEKVVSDGNLWMYGGDVTYRDSSGTPTSTVMWDGAVGAGITHGAAVAGIAPNRINTRTVIDDAVGFHDGHIGNIRDAVCLKCHGFKYWPLWDSTHAGDRSFANK